MSLALNNWALDKRGIRGLSKKGVFDDNSRIIFTNPPYNYIEGGAQDYGNSNIFLKPLFRGNLDPFVNNANLGAIAHTSNGT